MIELLEPRIAPATFTVTSLADAGAGSLREALNQADLHAGPDTIVFRLPAPPAHSENSIVLTGELVSNGHVTIKGPGAGRLIIDGNGLGRVFHFDDGDAVTDSKVKISRLSIINGKTAGDGGGLLSYESLTLKGVVVSGHFGAIGGGVAVFGDQTAGTKVRLTKSFITNNQSDDTGGGLAVMGVKSVALDRTTVLGNGAQGAGGIFAVTHAAGTGIAITGCIVTGNFSVGGAGGLWVGDGNPSAASKIVLSGTKIVGNQSAGTADGGGGMFLGMGDAVIQHSTFRANSALHVGGGLAANGFTSLQIAGTTFSGNQTTDHNSSSQGGGGLFLSGNGAGDPLPVKISNSRFLDNRSDMRGGGLYAINGLALSVSGSEFTGNRAGDAGGGLATSGIGAATRVDLTVTGSLFDGNVAFEGGGIAAVHLDSVVSILNTKVTGNRGSFGAGGIEVRSLTGSVTIKNVAASGNDGADGGGLLIFNTPDFKVRGGTYTGNAATEGGGIHLQNSTGSILGAKVTGNVATSEGGGVFHDATGTVTLQIANVFANSAPVDPNASGVFTFV